MAHLKALAGQAAEERALAYLEARGFTLVERNFRCRLGEIDLVMLHGTHLVFVEVRSRTNRFVSAAESVNFRKQQKLARTAGFFLLRRPAFQHHPVRFDVVALDGPSPDRYAIQWLRDAFRPGG